jgi:two-component system, NtrC family, sensor kinase
MQSAPLPENEASRLRDLQQYHVLDTPPEAAFNDLTALAAQICGTPIALVSLIDAHKTPRDIAFCAHAIHDNDLFVVPEPPKTDDLPTTPSSPLTRTFDSMPVCLLVTPASYALGTLCVIDRAPKQLTGDQRGRLVCSRQ